MKKEVAIMYMYNYNYTLYLLSADRRDCIAFHWYLYIALLHFYNTNNIIIMVVLWQKVLYTSIIVNKSNVITQFIAL